MLNTSVKITSNRSTLFTLLVYAVGIIALQLLYAVEKVSAAEWKNTFSVSANAVYTNNSSIDEDDGDSDFIPTISGNWSSKGEGGRISVQSIGSLEVNNANGSRESKNLRMQTDANAELVERIVFVDAAVTASQNAIDPLSKSGVDNLNETTNTTTTYTARVSPYVVGRIKRYANFEARYTFDHVRNTEIDNGDTSSRDLALSLSSGTEFGRFSWGVSGSKRTTEPDAGDETERSSINFNVGHQINRKWRVTGSVGKEWSDFTSDGDTDGMSWEVGAVWTPSSRTSFDFGYGKRFTGSTGHLDFSHRSKKSVITASYSQDITDTTELLANQVVFNPLDPFGVVINPITGQPLLIADGAFLTNLTSNEQILNDRFSINYTLQGKRTRVTFSGDYTKQTGSDESETEGFGVGVDVSRELSGKISANAGLSLDKQKLADDSETDLATLSFGINQKLGKKTSLNLSYSHTERDSESAGDSFDEDRVTLSLTHDL